MTKRIHWRDERGQALAEFAIVLPILIVLLLSIVQFGVIFNHYVTLTDAVRAGSRVAAVSRMDSCPACKTETAVEDAAAGLTLSELDVQVESTWQPGEQVKVVATYPYEISILGKVVASGSLTSEVKERVE